MTMERKAHEQLRAYERLEVPVHWVDLCRAMRMMGLMADFSKGERLRISALLEKRIEAGIVKKLGRGVYTAAWKDHVSAHDAP